MEDIADPTDWLNTPLSSFSDLENALHCQICKEFYETPMITSCNHTFCSKCIRTSLSQDGKCPGCRSQDQASKLRNNWALEEVVGRFTTARPTALDVARKEKERQDGIANGARRPGKRKRQAVDAEMNDAGGRTTRSKSRRVAASQSSQTEPIEVGDDSDEEFVPQSKQNHQQLDDGLVECPLGCGKRMKEETVFGHLDKCEEEQEKNAQREREVNRARHFSQTNRGSTPNSHRISELNYGMMNQGALAKKLRDLGIPSWGTKQLMQKRHTEWVNLWNANTDSNSPQNKRELLRELDSWERTQGGKAPNANGPANGVMRKDFDGDDWASRNKDQFSKLIADARRKK
ncbi:DNA repair protein rad18, partial [Polychaeton citri CBS 116435]